jgi:uncharacterized phage protein gp47/JayE
MAGAAPTIADLVEQGRAELLDRRPDLDALPGDITDFLLHAGAAGGDRVLLYAAQRVAATFLDTAEGDDLTALVEDRYGFSREPATAAIGAVEFTAPGGPTSGTITAGFRVATVADPVTGAFTEYTTDVNLTFTAEAGPKSVAVTATTAGAATNATTGTVIRTLDATFDTFTVTNPERMAGGNEEETDEELRARARAFFPNQRRGTADALVVGALQVPSVRKATVFDDGTGLITVYVADSEGASNLEMIQLVETELETWRAAGVVVQVSGSTPVPQNITLVLTVRAGVSTVAIADAVEAAVTAFVNRLQSGETLYRQAVSSAAQAVNPDDILTVVVTLPVADIVPQPNEVIRAGVVGVA